MRKPLPALTSSQPRTLTAIQLRDVAGGFIVSGVSSANRVSVAGGSPAGAATVVSSESP